MKNPKQDASEARTRPDGRSQLLIYMDPEIIEKLKHAALEEKTKAYVLAETAISEWLKRRKQKSAPKKRT